MLAAPFVAEQSFDRPKGSGVSQQCGLASGEGPRLSSSLAEMASKVVCEPDPAYV